MRLLATIALVALPTLAWPTLRPAGAGTLPAYAISDLGPTEPGARSLGLAINDAGQVAGAAEVGGAFQAFRSAGSGAIQGLGSLAGPQGTSRGVAINSAGVVVGSSASLDGWGRAFKASGDSMTDLGVLPGGSWSEAVAINDRGQVAGNGTRADGRTVAFRVDAQGQFVELGTLPDGLSSRAYAINGHGQVVGEAKDRWGITRAFIADEHGMRFAGTLPGGGSSMARAINDDGLMTGFATDASGRELAFVGRPGALVSLGVLPDGNASYGLDINALGQVVGTASVGGGDRAFLWTAEGGMIDLNLAIEPGSGWVLHSASGINNDGLIVGTGSYRGVTRAFLLRPTSYWALSPPAAGTDGPGGIPNSQSTPEPSTLALILIGAGGLGAWARLRRILDRPRGPAGCRATGFRSG